MRRIFVSCCMALAVAAVSIVPAQAAHRAHHPRRAVRHVPRPPQIPAGWPKYLIIPKLRVDAPVESLDFGNISEEMAPLRWSDVAWYDRGPKPGALGRAEIWGHLDSYCCPAVFYELKTLGPGDVVEVQYRMGKPLTFKVQWTAEYPNTDLPMRFIYGPSRVRGLFLFTCAGIFHDDGTGYDHRLIVYAKLSY